MTKWILAFLMMSAGVSYAWEAPEILENACWNNSCTEKMKLIYEGFLNNPQAPQFIPGMYSGACYHRSHFLDPDVQHYIGLLIDRHPQGHYMAPVFQYFGQSNDMKDWSLEKARTEASPTWKDIGPMKVRATSATEWVPDGEGYPAIVYWARQNTETKTIYFLAYFRGQGYAFCEAYPNVDGLETP